MKPASMVSRRAALILVALLLLAALVWVALRTGPMAPVRVTVTQAHQGRIEPSLFGIGTVEAQRSYLLGPTTPGRVLSVAVDVGDRVRADQVLAEMDPVDLEERLAASTAAIARAGRNVAAAEAQRQDTQARQSLADLNARRYDELARQEFVSESAVQAKAQELASATAALLGSEASLGAARHDLERLQAERAGLQQQRANVRLVAPVDGVVISRDAEPGATVVAGQPVVRIVDPDSLWIRLRIDQGRSAGLASGLAAHIVLRSSPGTPPRPGAVARVEAVSDSVTEERIAMVRFDTPAAGVTIGELAEVTLALPATQPALLLPLATVQGHGERTGVWRVRDDRLEFVPVRLGQRSLDGQVQILEGLSSQDSVVVFSEKALAADVRIRVVDQLGASAK